MAKALKVVMVSLIVFLAVFFGKLRTVEAAPCKKCIVARF